EQFWSLYDHLIRPSSLPTTTDLHIFREGIQPTWEDPSNARGGKWLIRLKKGLASRYWEELVLALIGGQFSISGHLPHDEICGAVVSIRFNEDIVSVWNRHAGNAEVIERVRDCIKRILSLPNHAYLEYKPHMDSLADKSSFRNTTVWRPKSSLDKGVGGEGGGGNGGPPRRMPSWGEREDNTGKERGNVSKPVRSEVERAWR
ncbi:hypothetical protein ACHAXN_000614, partial [Cyclotella atomus]